MASAGLLALSHGTARATEYPYCMTYVSGWSGAIERCDYSTMAQCQASASGLNGSCNPNWRLAWNKNQSSPVTDPDAPKKRVRH